MSSTTEDDREDSLVAALARGATQSRAAQESGLSPRTVRRRLADVGFRAKVATARSEMIGRAAGTVAAAATTALKTLVDLMSSGKSETARLQAAKTIVDQLPLNTILQQLAERPEAQTIEVVVADWREEYREMNRRGLARSATDNEKRGRRVSGDDGQET